MDIWDLMDALDEKGIPVYWVLDKKEELEEKGVPVKSITLGILVILLALAVYMMLPVQRFTLIVNVKGADDIRVTAEWNGESITKMTSNSRATFEIPKGEEVTVIAKKKGCKTITESVKILDDYSMVLTMEC
ncbi:MAG: hypothetical protein J7K68_00335 [Candidatus Diapherotrites archaeon]|nr:hypothetical protein [Candidatus Diapherotrites archaeon]